jgi:hypothetical protein
MVKLPWLTQESLPHRGVNNAGSGKQSRDECDRQTFERIILTGVEEMTSLNARA